VRIDTINTGWPEQAEAATAYLPARTFAKGDNLKWRDASPRLGASYDLFGNGKTAVKGSVSRYVQSETTRNTLTVNPANASAAVLTRTWNDTTVCPTCISNDFIPQGDPTIVAANGEIGPSPNANWGLTQPSTRQDPAWSQGGWGVR